MSDLDAKELRRHGHFVADWIADYLAGIEARPVLPAISPGEVKQQLPATAPEQPEPIDAILADFERIVVPASTHWNHPGFHAYFANTASGPGILAESLTAALNANAMLWRTAPAATELEEVVLDWLRQMLGVSGKWFGHINDTASVGTIVALAAARHRVAPGAMREQGVRVLAEPRIYCSTQTHSSIEKAAMLLGLGRACVIKIGVDESFRLRPDLLEARLREDRAHGCTPVAVVATVGTTATTAIDPVQSIAEICRRESVFLHVDAAYGGAMAILPEQRDVMAGVEAADSFLVNPHKWIFTPMDCSCLWVKDEALLRDAFSLVPSYLETSERGQARDLMNYGPALGRRFRALKLWFVLRAFGSSGIAERIRHHLELARELSAWIEAEPQWELLVPTRMAVVLFRHRPSGMDEAALTRHNQMLLDRINASGHAFLSHTLVGDERFALRVSIGNLRTQRRHVEGLWAALRELADGLRGQSLRSI
jgi:aromatic-L-amino-acid decarboxylase